MKDTYEKNSDYLWALEIALWDNLRYSVQKKSLSEWVHHLDMVGQCACLKNISRVALPPASFSPPPPFIPLFRSGPNFFETNEIQGNLKACK